MNSDTISIIAYDVNCICLIKCRRYTNNPIISIQRLIHIRLSKSQTNMILACCDKDTLGQLWHHPSSEPESR